MDVLKDWSWVAKREQRRKEKEIAERVADRLAPKHHFIPLSAAVHAEKRGDVNISISMSSPTHDSTSKDFIAPRSGTIIGAMVSLNPLTIEKLVYVDDPVPK
jgi:hypothetical protein